MKFIIGYHQHYQPRTAGGGENTSEGYQLIDQLGPDLCTLPDPSHRELLVCVFKLLPSGAIFT